MSESEVKAKDRLNKLAEGERHWIHDQLDGTSMVEESLLEVDEAVKESLAQLQADILAIIGEDEPDKVVRDNGDGSKVVMVNPKNQLRAELRQALHSYFKGGE